MPSTADYSIRIRYRCPNWISAKGPEKRLSNHRDACGLCRDTWIEEWKPISEIIDDINNRSGEKLNAIND